MKKRFFSILSLALIATASLAQNVSDGFYRVQNFGSKRYTYIYDNTGSIDWTATKPDMGAIVLHLNAQKRFTDPASVIYISNHGKSGNYTLYDLEAQGTGVHKIIDYYVAVSYNYFNDTYLVYEPSHSMYLWDAVSSGTIEESYMTISNGRDPNLRYWSVFPVDASTDEYLGIAPDVNIKANGKYYKPYYLSFALNLASSGMKAYYVSDVKADAVIISEVNGTIPAETPVIVECSSAEATQNRVNPSASKLAPITDNKLKGNYFCYGDHGPTAYKIYDAATMRILTVKDGKLQYATDPNHKHTEYLYTANGDFYCIKANESYLEVPAGFPESLPVMTQAEYDALHPASITGDVNNDGTVNAIDVAMIYHAIAAGTSAAAAPQYDVNADGVVNAIDVAMVYHIIAQKS